MDGGWMKVSYFLAINLLKKIIYFWHNHTEQRDSDVYSESMLPSTHV
jgi:hypothetical protein